ADTRAEPDRDVLDIEVQEILDEARWALRSRQVGILGCPRRDPDLLARYRVVVHRCGASKPAAVGHALVIVLDIQIQCLADLLQVGEAGRLPGLVSRLGEDREEERRDNGDNSNNDEQLDQRESRLARPAHVTLLVRAREDQYRARRNRGA